MSGLHGYALADALERESGEIANERRAELVSDGAKEIRALIQQNRQLMDACDAAHRSMLGTVSRADAHKQIKSAMELAGRAL